MANKIDTKLLKPHELYWNANGMKTRQGKFRVTRKFTESELFPKIFSKLKFACLNVDIFDYGGQITYAGYSPYFDQLIEGESIPEYQVNLHVIDDMKEKGLEFSLVRL